MCSPHVGSRALHNRLRAKSRARPSQAMDLGDLPRRQATADSAAPRGLQVGTYGKIGGRCCAAGVFVGAGARTGQARLSESRIRKLCGETRGQSFRISSPAGRTIPSQTARADHAATKCDIHSRALWSFSLGDRANGRDDAADRAGEARSRQSVTAPGIAGGLSDAAFQPSGAAPPMVDADRHRCVRDLRHVALAERTALALKADRIMRPHRSLRKPIPLCFDPAVFRAAQ
jgi:hypothetical protein